MTLVVRFPRIDYSKIRAHWSRNIAFAQYQNATSLIPTPIEPWLIKVLQIALPKLPRDNNAKLRQDIADFIGQESQHFRQHRMFNRVIAAQGYPELYEYERKLTEDLEEFLQNRSLKFMLAYADGFEALGATQGYLWFGKLDHILEGADPNAVALWKWHMAEEFEHREVCFQVFHRIYSRGLWNKIWNGYFYRIYGFIYAMAHLRGYMDKMFAYLLEQDRMKISETEKAELEKNIKELQNFQLRVYFPQLLKNFLPWYDPGKKRTPTGLFEYLRGFEKPAAEPGA